MSFDFHHICDIFYVGEYVVSNTNKKILNIIEEFCMRTIETIGPVGVHFYTFCFLVAMVWGELLVKFWFSVCIY